MNLYHYYEKARSPFLTLSDLSSEEARKMQDGLKTQDNVYDRRDHDGKYMHFRRIVENNVRLAFIEKTQRSDFSTPENRAYPLFCLETPHNLWIR